MIKIVKRSMLCIGIIALTGTLSFMKAQEVLTLEKAMAFAEQNSPDIQRSLLNLERYQQSLKAQRAGLKSKFFFELNPLEYSHQRQFEEVNYIWYTREEFYPKSTFAIEQPILPTGGTISLRNQFGWRYYSSESELSGSNEDKRFTNNLYLSFDQPLFTYNSKKMELEELELSFENANLNYAMQRLNLEITVTRQFYNVHMAQMNLNISREELANTKKSHEIIKNKVDAGLAAKEELFQAELNLATAQSTLQNREVTLENAKDDLKQYLGMDILKDIAVLADVSANPVAVDMDKAIEHGLNSRMELRQREIDIEQSLFQLIKTKAIDEFRGDLSLSIGIAGDNEKFGDIYAKPTNTPGVSLSFRIPIFDWGAQKARIKAQEAVVKSSELDYDEQRKGIILNIRKVYRNIKNQLAQITIAEQNVKNAELTYDINLERYENGDLTGMDLNLYQNQLSNKKISLAQALINYKIELLNLKVQSLFDFQNNEAIVPTELYLKN